MVDRERLQSMSHATAGLGEYARSPKCPKLADFSRFSSGLSTAALLPKADCCTAQRDFRDVPTAEVNAVGDPNKSLILWAPTDSR